MDKPNKQQPLKHFLMQHLPHRALRTYLQATEFRHKRIIRGIRRDLGLKPSNFDTTGLRRSDTVFLLGSGASINAISEQRWRGIAAGDSIGLNFWIRHPFVPTFYFFEAAPPYYFDRICDLARRRQKDYSGVVKVATMHINHPPQVERQFEQLPKDWRNDMWPLETVTMFARNLQELRQELKRFGDEGIFEPVGPILKLFKYMGTMTSLITLSVKMGYRNIVLCGVDLTTPGYFYQDETLYPDMKGFLSGAPTKRHVLMADDQPHISADQVIWALEKLVVKPAGAQLFVENAMSGLFPTIPLAPDEVLG